MVEQKLIVIALKDRFFMKKKAILEEELDKGWLVKDIKLGISENGKQGFMTVLLEQECVDKKSEPIDMNAVPYPVDFLGVDEQDYIMPPDYDPDSVAFRNDSDE